MSTFLSEHQSFYLTFHISICTVQHRKFIAWYLFFIYYPIVAVDIVMYIFAQLYFEIVRLICYSANHLSEFKFLKVKNNLWKNKWSVFVRVGCHMYNKICHFMLIIKFLFFRDKMHLKQDYQQKIFYFFKKSNLSFEIKVVHYCKFTILD